MSSCKFEGGKCHGGAEASAYLRHNEITPENRKRVLEAKRKNDEECHIDPSKSHLNYSFTGYTYEQAFKSYQERIKELDGVRGSNKRKDRVTMQAIEVPVPEGLPEEKYKEFFENVTKIMTTMYGERNMIDASVHYDEQHEYIDPDTKEKRMSRVHCHYCFIPEVDEQLNAKQFSRRANINKLNNAIERMTVDCFDCHFHTGTKKKSKKTVKELKAASAVLEEQEKQRKAFEAELQAERDKFTVEKEKWQEKANNELIDALLDIQTFKSKQEESSMEQDMREYMSSVKTQDGKSIYEYFILWRNNKIEQEKKQAEEKALSLREKLLAKGREQQRRKQQQEAAQSTIKPKVQTVSEKQVAKPRIRKEEKPQKPQEPTWFQDVRAYLDAQRNFDIENMIKFENNVLSKNNDFISIDEAISKYQDYQNQHDSQLEI